jgi:hypothetical protein
MEFMPRKFVKEITSFKLSIWQGSLRKVKKEVCYKQSNLKISISHTIFLVFLKSPNHADKDIWNVMAKQSRVTWIGLTFIQIQ